MLTENYMVRVTTPFFYTLEFLVALGIFLLVFYFFVRNIDKKSLLVFIIAGAINTSIELMLQGLNIRNIEGAFFFNIPIGFPFICFILGFYEGGVKTLIAYHFVRMIFNSDKLSKRMLIILLAVVFISFFTYSSLAASGIGSPDYTTTARDMFAPLGIFLLSVAFAGSAGYFLLRKIPRPHKISLLYYELGLVLYLLVWMSPLHVFSLRYIGVLEMGSYVPVGL